MNEALEALGMTKEKAIFCLERLIGEDEDRDYFSLDEKMSMELAISALSENKGEWIPVTERLPESGKEVLFCDIDDDIRLGYHIKDRPRTHFTEYGSWECMKNVVAWQPLPEPYKKGE